MLCLSKKIKNYKEFLYYFKFAIFPFLLKLLLFLLLNHWQLLFRHIYLLQNVRARRGRMLNYCIYFTLLGESGRKTFILSLIQEQFYSSQVIVNHWKLESPPIFLVYDVLKLFELAKLIICYIFWEKIDLLGSDLTSRKHIDYLRQSHAACLWYYFQLFEILGGFDLFHL